MRTILILLLSLLGGAAAAQRITVAAAADLNPTAQEIAAAFEKQTGIAVRVSYGSSGNISSQIRNGAPYDVFLSADEAYPKALVTAGLATGLTWYGQGRLVLWVSNRAGVDVAQGMKVLEDARITRIAVANPEHAPYGKAALAAIEHLGMQDVLRPKLVFGESVSQAAQFAQSGHAAAALIAMSLAMHPAMRSAGKYVEVPSESYPPLRQAGVIVKRSKNPGAAKKFLEFLKNGAGRDILRKHGFVTE